MTAETEIQIDLLVDPEWNLILRARFPDQRPPQLGKLPPEYGVEPVPFRITPGPSGRLEQAHWIWHRRDPKRYIMGGAIFHKF
ncbi:MAG: hypothetical protein Q8R28_05820, partial [Dehalococcoidia bacterium]|nr:hypothetical protein [Dehalococcoidia bacterium]